MIVHLIDGTYELFRHLSGQRRGITLVNQRAAAARDSLLSLPTFVNENRALKISLAIFRDVERFLAILVTILLLESVNTLTIKEGHILYREVKSVNNPNKIQVLFNSPYVNQNHTWRDGLAF